MKLRTLADSERSCHGLRFTVNRRFTSGFQLHANYTFSKATDDHSGWASVSDYAGDRQGYGDEKIHALSSYDIRHSFYSSFTYDVPRANLRGAAGKILGGWSMTGFLRLNSGTPMTLLAGQPRRGSLRLQNVEGRTVDLIPGGDQNPSRPQNPNEYFDVTQFAFPVPFFEGNLGRNTLTAPRIAKFDFTLMKSTSLPIIHENTNLQFRAEFFNLFNRANFGHPGAQEVDFDGEGNVWTNYSWTGGIMMFNPKTKKFTSWMFPDKNPRRLMNSTFDSKRNRMWFGTDDYYGKDETGYYDAKTGDYRVFPNFPAYGEVTDSNGNHYGMLRGRMSHRTN